jgi:hypothetical protein
MNATPWEASYLKISFIHVKTFYILSDIRYFEFPLALTEEELNELRDSPNLRNTVVFWSRLYKYILF